jgi:AraC-like DNA-binding protein
MWSNRSPCTSWSGRSACCWPWAGITRSSRPAPRQQGYRPNLKAPALEDRTIPVSRTAAALVRLERGFAEDLRLEDLAMACHMSASHFSRIFKKEHGTSFRRYLLLYRLERACKLLAMAETSVKQAASAAGFSDCSYFGRVFRRRYGMTPRDYQAQHSAPRSERAPGGARS